MNMRLGIGYLVGVLLSLPNLGAAQNIVLDDSLAANADMYKVKMGSAGPGKAWKISFGDYAVISSKSGLTLSSGKANWLGTRRTSETKHKFSFVLGHTSGLVADVHAATYRVAKWEEPLQVSPTFFIGDELTILDSSNFTADIMLNQDTANMWTLVMILSGSSSSEHAKQAFLTNGTRKIFLVTVTSNRYGNETRSLPATGYEVLEEGRAIGALQDYGGGMWGTNKYIIWMHRELDPEMRLLLAAALTAVIQAHVPSFSN